MKTLYDLLGALAEDDADGIRAAFRRAARANHPDNNPGDADAPLRFRRIVRANAILSDKRQRAAYDRLLAVALRQRHPGSRRGDFSSGIRTLASGAISGALFSAMSIGIYLLLGHMSAAPLARDPVTNAPGAPGSITGQHAATGQVAPPKDQTEVKQASRQALAETTAESSRPEAAEKAEASTLETSKPAGEAMATAAAAPTDAGSVEAKIDAPPREAVVKDARYYRERGMQAYRNGDLALALIDFDLAISLDPDISDLYIDRAIVLQRMGDARRALDDVAHAKRIDDSSQGKRAGGTTGTAK